MAKGVVDEGKPIFNEMSVATEKYNRNSQDLFIIFDACVLKACVFPFIEYACGKLLNVHDLKKMHTKGKMSFLKLT